MQEHVELRVNKSTGCKIMDSALDLVDRASAYHNLTQEAQKMVTELRSLLVRKQRLSNGASARRVRQQMAKLNNELAVVDLLDLLRNIVLNTAVGDKFSYPMNNGQFALCIDGVSRGAFFTMQSLTDESLPSEWIDGIPPRVYFAEFTAGLDPKLLGTKCYPIPITRAVRWIHRNGGIDALKVPTEEAVH